MHEITGEYIFILRSELRLVRFYQNNKVIKVTTLENDTPVRVSTILLVDPFIREDTSIFLSSATAKGSQRGQRISRCPGNYLLCGCLINIYLVPNNITTACRLI